MEMLVDHDTGNCHIYTLLFPGLDLRAALPERLRARAAQFRTIECILDRGHGYADLCCSVDKEPGHITRHICLQALPWRLGSGYV